jgi:hypothetical protein
MTTEDCDYFLGFPHSVYLVQGRFRTIQISPKDLGRDSGHNRAGRTPRPPEDKRKLSYMTNTSFPSTHG